MKFTKQQLSDALKAKLTENGKHLSISVKTLTSQSDNLYDLLVKEDSELDDVVSKVLPQFTTLNGNYEKDNADFIKKWKEEHPLPKPPSLPDDNPGDTRLDTLLKEIQGMKEEREKEKAERDATRKRAELLAKLKEKGVKDEKWTDAYLRKVSVTGETDIESEAKDALEFYNLTHSDINPDLNPKPTGGGEHKDKDQFADIVAMVKRDRREE